MPSGRDRRRRREKERRGGMGNESAIINPKTGESYTGGHDTEEACAQRLRIAEAYRRLDAGDEDAFHKLLSGEDVEPPTSS